MTQYPDVELDKKLQSMSLEELIEFNWKHPEYRTSIASIMKSQYQINKNIVSIDDLDDQQKVSFQKEHNTICIDDLVLAIKFVHYFGDCITKLEFKASSFKTNEELPKPVETLARNYPNLIIFFSVRAEEPSYQLTERLFIQNPQIKSLELRNFRSLDFFRMVSTRLPNIESIFFEPHQDLFIKATRPIHFNNVRQLSLIVIVLMHESALSNFPLVFDQLENLYIYNYWENYEEWIDAISGNRTLNSIGIFNTPSDLYSHIRDDIQV